MEDFFILIFLILRYIFKTFTMKTLRKTILSLGLLLSGWGFAQTSMLNSLKVGLNIGAVLPVENANISAGLDMAYQNLVTPHFGLGIATGYSHYFGKNRSLIGGSIHNNDVGLVPAAMLLRYYPARTGFYFGADLGYGFLVGDDRVSSNFTVERPDGGFYIKPELGYHNRNWNFFLHYQKVFTGSKGEIGDQKYNIGSLGLGFSYNIALGK